MWERTAEAVLLQCLRTGTLKCHVDVKGDFSVSVGKGKGSSWWGRGAATSAEVTCAGEVSEPL